MCSVVSSPAQERNGHWRESSVELLKWWYWSFCPKKKGWESLECLFKGSGEISSMYVNSWRGMQRRQSQAFSSVPRDKTRGNRHKIKHRRVCLNFFALWGWSGTATSCPGRWWVLPPCRYSRAIRTWSWASGSKWPCLSREVERDDVQRLLPMSAILMGMWWCGDSPSCMVGVVKSWCLPGGLSSDLSWN